MDRRIDARFPPPLAGATRVTLRPGCIVVLIDLSAGGALVEAVRPLRPGARVHMQLVTDARTFAVSAHVLRCTVWSLDRKDGVTYRGALKFEHCCEWFWEGATPHGSALPSALAPAPQDPGQPLPAAKHSPSARDRRSAK